MKTPSGYSHMDRKRNGIEDKSPLQSQPKLLAFDFNLIKQAHRRKLSLKFHSVCTPNRTLMASSIDSRQKNFISSSEEMEFFFSSFR